MERPSLFWDWPQELLHRHRGYRTVDFFQLRCVDMYNNLLRSDGKQWLYSKEKFPSNLNCEQNVVSETGPCVLGDIVRANVTEQQ